MEDDLVPDSRESLDCKKLDGDGELLILVVELGVGMTTPTFTEQHLHFDTNYHSCQRASSPDAVHCTTLDRQGGEQLRCIKQVILGQGNPKNRQT
jgi:hypothetical protein